MSFAFGPVNQPAEQAVADQVIAATNDMTHYAAHAHVALHAHDEATVEVWARRMFHLAESLSHGQLINLAISLANLSAATACGDAADPANPGTIRVLR